MMKWEMEVDEIEAVLEKICDLHDKLSDAIHAISRAHFLKNAVRNPHRKKKSSDGNGDYVKNGSGFVFVKEFSKIDDEYDETTAVQEAKSLYAIRTALEHLEDQLEFFHTVQTQQRAERDGAIARLEQSRIILAMRLAEHQGKKYKVIEEAHALVGDVRDASRFASPENNPYNSTCHDHPESHHEGKKKPNALVDFFLSSCTFVSKSLKLDNTVGILGNAALLAISMLALVQLSGSKEKYTLEFPGIRETKKVNHSKLDVMLARG